MRRHVVDEVEDVVQDQDVDRLLSCSLDDVLQHLQYARLLHHFNGILLA